MEKTSLEDISKVLDFNFKNSLVLNPLEVYCPDCSKMYVVNPHEIMVPKPSFVCKSCPAHFYINYPECAFDSKVIGISIERKALSKVSFALKSDFLDTDPPQKSLEPKAHSEGPAPGAKVISLPPSEHRSDSSLKNPVPEVPIDKIDHQVTPVKACPKCEFINPASITECLKCSVIFDKIHSQTEFGQKVYASGELKDLWELALDNYEAESAHHNFIRYSHIEGNLEYASQKYNSILSVNPYDDIANKMKKQIITLSALDLEKSAIPPVKSIFRFFNLTTLSFALGLSLTLLGYIFPKFKNLVGIGAFSLCLIAGLKYLQIRDK